jgi:formyltetrahydrofolate deformylase
MSYSVRLLVSGPARKGLIAAVTSFIEEHNGYILEADEHLNPPPVHGRWFMRIEIEGEGFDLSREEFGPAFVPLAQQHGMDWQVAYTDQPKRMAIMVSKYDHCLIDLLWRWDAGELDAEIPLVISNHPDMYNIPFYHLPVTKETKVGQEGEALKLLAEHNVDFVVLARYMQILTPKFIDAYPNRIINIHHSFLPAFAGANPYERAYERGVKLIGATAHYVTEELDAGPIINQDAAYVSHEDTVEDLKRTGRDIERRVLSQAVRWHVEDRVMVDQARTVVFTGPGRAALKTG